MTRGTRQNFLKKHWGFECACSICSAPAESISTSNGRLKEINQLKEQLSTGLGDHRKVLEITASILRLFDEEGLITPKAKYYEIATYTANKIGDEKKASTYGKLAQTYWNIMAGPKSWEVRRIEDLLRNPKGHPSWGPSVSEEI